MKTRFSSFLLSIFILSAFFVNAQWKQIAVGPKFEEPVSGELKMLQMSNGTTVYVHFTAKEGYNVRIYDAQHAEKVSTSYTPSYERFNMPAKESSYSFYSPNHERILGFFELNNEFVMFIEEANKKKTSLYRVTIDLATGKPKEEKEIFVLKREGWFDIKRSADGEGYAILMLGSPENEEKTAEGPHIYLYAKTNKEINNAVCISPETDKDYEILEFMDMDVISSSRACILFEARGKKEGAKGTCYMAVLEKSGSLGFRKLSMPGDLLYYLGYVKYNPVTGKILCLSVAETKKESGEFNLFMNETDPESKQTKEITGFQPTEELNQAYKDTYDKKKDFSGYPEGIFPNADGSFSVIYEEVGKLSQGGSGYGRTDSKLGKMVIVTLGKDGKYKDSYLVPKAHWILFQSLWGFYYKYELARGIELFRGNQYKSFIYLSSRGGRFILFNDSERNNEVNKDKFVEIQGIDECDAFSYKLGGTGFFPKRDYFFGQQPKGHSLALFQASDYASKTGVYVTLQLTKESARDNQVNLVWMQMQ